MEKPRRVRIYKLSTFDSYTEEERKLHNIYKGREPGTKTIAGKKQDRDEKIAAFQGVRKVEMSKTRKSEEELTNWGQDSTDKEIALFESQFARIASNFKEKCPLIKEVVYMKIDEQLEIFYQILQRGIDIDGRHYIFYTSTTNQMKKGEFILMEENFYHVHEKEFLCGLTKEEINRQGGCNIGKFLAYSGLLFSTSFSPKNYRINIDECLVVPDFETILEEVVECIDHDDKEITGMEVRKEKIKVPQMDGAGMFLPGVLPAAAQIRCGHLKGCIFPFDFVKFLKQGKVNGRDTSPLLTDAWGKTHEVLEENIKVIFTASQLKMWKYYESWEEFKKCFKENHLEIGINKFGDMEPKGYARTSYQFLQTLDSEKLKADTIENLCKDTIAELKEMKTNPEKIMETVQGNYLAQAIKMYPALIQDSYVQNKLKQRFQMKRREASGGKLLLKDSLYGYICPDLYAFCEWLFCGNDHPVGLVPKDHVFNHFYDDKEYTTVDCLRSPHLYMEHGIRKLVKGADLEQCKEWFHGYDTVVSSHDLLCRILQFDVDGDEILLTPCKEMIECVPENKHILYYEPFEVEKSEVNNENIYKAIVASKDNSNIGDISNIMTKNYNNKETDEEFNKAMCCYNNLTIDFPKSQKNIDLGKYQKKYGKLLKEKSPYLFQYAKDKTRKNCKPVSGSNCDRICMYIQKETANKKYNWNGTEKFNPGMLFDTTIMVNNKDVLYIQMEKLLLQLKNKYNRITFLIKEEMKRVEKSEGYKAAVSQYDVFYDMCRKLFVELFTQDQKMAAAYLLDCEYKTRKNEDDMSGKSILWNSFGDVICENIARNKEVPDEVKSGFRYRYLTEKCTIKQVEKNVVEELKKPVCTVYKEEIEWLEQIDYGKYETDRELLYLLLVYTKIHDGKAYIFAQKKKRNGLNYNKLDRFIGKEIAKRGIQRLKKLGVIKVDEDYKTKKKITLTNKPEGQEIAFEVTGNFDKNNPLYLLYEYTGERKVETCVVCGRRFIRKCNQKTCSAVCGKTLELRIKRKNS